MKEQILCVDIGTSSLKCAVIDEDGNLIAYDREIFLLRSTSHGAKEWIDALKKAVSQIREADEEVEFNISAVCISGNGPTLVSESGRNLLWNTDISDLKIEYSGKSLFIPRILGFKNKYPETWNKTKYIFGCPEFLIWQLTGKALTILPGERFKDAYWDDESLKQAGLSAEEIKKLPEFYKSSSEAGFLTKEAVSYIEGNKLGLEADKTKVFCGAPDYISALVGTGTVAPGKLCDRAGSSEGINITTSKPYYAEGVRTLPSIIDGLWNESVLLPDTGIRLTSFKMQAERLYGFDLQLNSLVEKCLSEDKNDFFEDDRLDEIFSEGRALMEEIAVEVKIALEKLKNACGSEFKFPEEMTVTGGQTGNSSWNKYKAKVCGIKIISPVCSDSELVGNAAFAFYGMGKFKTLAEASEKLFCAARVFN